MGFPKIGVAGRFKVLDSQGAGPDPTQHGILDGPVLVECGPAARQGAFRNGVPQKFAVDAPVALGAVAGMGLGLEVVDTGPMGGAKDGRFLLGIRIVAVAVAVADAGPAVVLIAPNGSLDLAVLSEVGDPVVAGLGAVAKALRFVDGSVRTVRQPGDAFSSVVANMVADFLQGIVGGRGAGAVALVQASRGQVQYRVRQGAHYVFPVAP